jgi:hypothetical protein
MSTNDYVKFVTQQIVSYIDQPKDQRKQQKSEKRGTKQPLSYRYFGMIPLAISLFIKKKKK